MEVFKFNRHWKESNRKIHCDNQIRENDSVGKPSGVVRGTETQSYLLTVLQ